MTTKAEDALKYIEHQAELIDRFLDQSTAAVQQCEALSPSLQDAMKREDEAALERLIGPYEEYATDARRYLDLAQKCKERIRQKAADVVLVMSPYEYAHAISALQHSGAITVNADGSITLNDAQDEEGKNG
jgi:N-acetylglucosamine kinase-like BadF-type ATPase